MRKTIKSFGVREKGGETKGINSRRTNMRRMKRNDNEIRNNARQNDE